MKLLFISHTFPPIIGGVESHNWELSRQLEKKSEKFKLMANRRRFLVLPFLVYASVRAVFLASQYDAVILGSCLLAPVGWLVKKTTRTPVVAVAHGLDLTWRNWLYQKLWLPIFIPSLDKLIAVGNETIQEGKKRGLSEKQFVFIPNGVDIEHYRRKYDRKKLDIVLGQKTEKKKILLTSGRLARRKGVAWFVHNVMPFLAEDILYVIAGDGSDKKNILASIKDAKMGKRVKILGYVSDETRDLLFSSCDVFVQPNIKIFGDMEGFGLSVIEAAACELPVIASRLEGLQDAIKDGENGFLVESERAEDWVLKIKELLTDDAFRQNFGKKARQFVVENYAWPNIADRYREEIKKVVQEKSASA